MVQTPPLTALEWIRLVIFFPNSWNQTQQQTKGRITSQSVCDADVPSPPSSFKIPSKVWKRTRRSSRAHHRPLPHNKGKKNYHPFVPSGISGITHRKWEMKEVAAPLRDAAACHYLTWCILPFAGVLVNVPQQTCCCRKRECITLLVLFGGGRGSCFVCLFVLFFPILVCRKPVYCCLSIKKNRFFKKNRMSESGTLVSLDVDACVTSVFFS